MTRPILESTSQPATRSRPLDGIRVLDLSRFIAGPYIGRLLADLGADVVKLEPPEGDGTRQFGVVRDGLAGLYVQQNAGKRNVGIDLKMPGAVELALELAKAADVVIENFRPGVIARLGLGWEKLTAVNPRLIMVSISGFGQEGPESQRQAYAPIIHAESGWRRGQHLDIAMLDAWHATDDYLHYLLDGAEKPVLQGGEVFETPGGPLMLNRTLPHVWKLLKAAYGLVSDEAQGADVTVKARCRRAAVLRWMASFPERDALKRALEKANLAWAEVRTSATLLDSPTVAARDLVASVADDRGNVRLVAQSPYRFSAAASGVRGPAPRLGQHNAAVLGDWLGLDGTAIESLRDRRVLTEEAPAP